MEDKIKEFVSHMFECPHCFHRYDNRESARLCKNICVCEHKEKRFEVSIDYSDVYLKNRCYQCCKSWTILTFNIDELSKELNSDLAVILHHWLEGKFPENTELETLIYKEP